jgi:hypothetical protein
VWWCRVSAASTSMSFLGGPSPTSRNGTELGVLVSGPWRGKLVILPRLRGGDWLEDEITGRGVDQAALHGLLKKCVI